MESQIVKIGNSKGVRIPKPMLEQCQLVDEVELEARPGQLIVRPAGGPRHGWPAAFEKMSQYGDDALRDDGDPATKWTRKDWKW